MLNVFRGGHRTQPAMEVWNNYVCRSISEGQDIHAVKGLNGISCMEHISLRNHDGKQSGIRGVFAAVRAAV